MFTEDEVDNDLKKIDEAIREYYGLEKENDEKAKVVQQENN